MTKAEMKDRIETLETKIAVAIEFADKWESKRAAYIEKQDAAPAWETKAYWQERIDGLTRLIDEADDEIWEARRELRELKGTAA